MNPPVRPRRQPPLRWRRIGQGLTLPALALGLLSACDGSGLIGHRLSGDWCLPTGSDGRQALILSLSGDGTGLMALIPGTRPSLPFDWREDRERLLLLEPGGQVVAYTVPIVADAQGQPQLMIPGLGSLLDTNLRRCATAAATPGPPAVLPPAGGPAPLPPPTAAPVASDSSGVVTLAVVLGGAMLLLLAGAITVVLLLRGNDED